jgi:HD-GYP domain-containing protein (c-di-GMP phosphodiesterase class II)
LDWHKILFNLYFTGVSLAGLVILAFAFQNLNPDNIYVYLFWIAVFVIAEMKTVPFDVKGGQVSVGFAINLAMLMIYGTSSSIVITSVGSALADIIGRRGWQKVVFNTAQYSISLFAAGMVYEKLSPADQHILAVNQYIVPFIFTTLTFVIFNITLVAIIVSLSLKIALIDIIKMDLGMNVLFLTSLAPLSLLMVILYINEPWSIILILPPLALAHNSFKNYLKLRQQTRTTIELLADVVDRRDPYTASHSFRVAKYAEQIARQMGLPYEQIENVIMAGRVHDLGKIGVSDDILLKPAPLTDIEYKHMKNHPKIGYNILSSLEMYENLLSFVLYHHERMDGCGYPHGLNANSIPLGARILAVADSFDAMTSDRPYRKAMSEEKAFQELKKNSGTQFDPKVVDAFIEVWEREKAVRERYQ